MDHYFTNNEELKSDESIFEAELLGRKFKFTTDRGVFSKDGVDFGSRLLIENFQIPDVAGDLLDVGCGYGVMGLSLAHLCSKRLVHMVDVNLRALDLTSRNALANKLENVKIYESFCYDNVQERFAAIVSNPPIRAGKKVVHQILEEAPRKLAPGGQLWIVIQKKQGAESARKKMAEVFGNCELVVKKKGFQILVSKVY